MKRLPAAPLRLRCVLPLTLHLQKPARQMPDQARLQKQVRYPRYPPTTRASKADTNHQNSAGPHNRQEKQKKQLAPTDAGEKPTLCETHTFPALSLIAMLFVSHPRARKKTEIHPEKSAEGRSKNAYQKQPAEGIR